MVISIGLSWWFCGLFGFSSQTVEEKDCEDAMIRTGTEATAILHDAKAKEHDSLITVHELNSVYLQKYKIHFLPKEHDSLIIVHELNWRENVNNNRSNWERAKYEQQ